MKKKGLAIISIVVLVILMTVNFSTVILIGNKSVTAKYIYGDKNIITELSDEDAKSVKKILNGEHISVFALPACGFDENVAVLINNKTFCIACDVCGTVYFKERNGYIILDEDENEELRRILSGYGFEWPCH